MLQKTTYMKLCEDKYLTKKFKRKSFSEFIGFLEEVTSEGEWQKGLVVPVIHSIKHDKYYFSYWRLHIAYNPQLKNICMVVDNISDLEEEGISSIDLILTANQPIDFTDVDQLVVSGVIENSFMQYLNFTNEDGIQVHLAKELW